MSNGFAYTLKSGARSYIDRLIVRRQKSAAERLLLEGLKRTRPAWMKYRQQFLSDFVIKRRVAVVSPSDAQQDLYRRLRWGDTWAKSELIKALGKLGEMVTELEPDVVIHLWGRPAEYLPSSAFKIIWIYSHPEKVTADLLQRYDRIFCLSSTFAAKVRQMGFDANVMWSATSKRPRASAIKYDVVFVGNARADGRRKIVDDVGAPDYRFKVWGGRYQQLPDRYWAGEYIDYTELDDLYSSSLITLNDHRPQMAAEGFVAIRIFDILASGGFCISDANPGVDEIFGEAVPQYHSASELRELIDWFLSHPAERQRFMERGREIALAHSWNERAKTLMQGIHPAST